MAENETTYFLCSDCERTLREEELMTHIEYDQRLLERSWTPPVGEHSDWWYEKIAPLNLKEGEIVHVCRFCGEIGPVEGVPTVEGKSVADLRMVLNALDATLDDASRAELELQKKDLELVLNDYFYSNYIIDQENVKERLNTTSGTFHIYDDESIRFEDVMRRQGHYFRVPVYKWEKIANEYAEPTSLIEFFNEDDGWTMDVDTFAKYDYKKQYGPKMIRFQEIDWLLLKKSINRLEEEIAMLKKKLGE